MIQKKGKVILIAVIVIIMFATPLFYFNGLPRSNPKPLPPIKVQTLNNSCDCEVNPTIISNVSSRYETSIYGVSAFSNISESGYGNSTVSLDVIPSVAFLPCSAMLLFFEKVRINGSFYSNLKPSELIINQSANEHNDSKYVGAIFSGCMYSSCTGNSNVSINPPDHYTNYSKFSKNPVVFFHINEKFVNDSLLSNGSIYHFASCLKSRVYESPLGGNNLSRTSLFMHILPVTLTTNITIEGLSKLIRQQVIINFTAPMRPAVAVRGRACLNSEPAPKIAVISSNGSECIINTTSGGYYKFMAQKDKSYKLYAANSVDQKSDSYVWFKTPNKRGTLWENITTQDPKNFESEISATGPKYDTAWSVDLNIDTKSSFSTVIFYVPNGIHNYFISPILSHSPSHANGPVILNSKTFYEKYNV